MTARMLVETTREWPNGLVLLTDPASGEDVPHLFDPRGVAAGRTVVAAPILHGADGAACAQVWVGRVLDNLSCVFKGEFETSSGAVIVSDTSYALHTPAHVGEGIHGLRILVEEEPSPTRVVFEFRQ